MYQNECDDVLWDYWSKGQAINKRHTVSPEQKSILQEVVERKAGDQRALRAQIWTRHNRHFNINSYHELLAIHFDDAVKYLDEYSPSDDAMVSPAAIAALGNAYAHVNQLDKAISSLKKAADMADSEGQDGVNNSLSPTFRLQAAILLESQGKKEDALKIYQDIKSKYVNSPLVQSQEIDKYIERASR